MSRYISVAAVLLFVLYVGGASAAYLLARAVGSPQIRWTDCLFYPWRKDDLQLRQAKEYSRVGLAALDAGDYHRARSLLAAAITKDPYSWQARAALARLIYSAGPWAKERALNLALSGLPYSAHEPGYMEPMMAMVAHSGDIPFAMQFCDDAIEAASSKATPEHIRWLTRRRAEALLASERPAEALALIKGLDDQNWENIFIIARAHLAQEEPAVASEKIQDWLAFPGREQQPRLLDLLVLAQRQAGDLEGMEKTLSLQIQQDPTATDPRIALVMHRVLAGKDSGAAEAMEDYLLRFDTKPDLLIKIARPLSELGKIDLLLVCLARANDLGQAGIGLRELLAEGYLRNNDWYSVVPLLSEIRERRKLFSLPPGRWQEFHEALLRALLDPIRGAQSSFLDNVKQDAPHVDALLRLIVLLEKAGRDVSAQELRAIARVIHPKDAEKFRDPEEFDTVPET